jgi:dTDP-4-dehydrorhamnose 3,5-epimerase
MPEIRESKTIQGVQLVSLRPHEDERGRFVEIFRMSWFPQRPWSAVQSNRSQSEAGVLRGLHYHHRQVDYWFVDRGRIRVGLVDLRRSSPSFRRAEAIELDELDFTGLYIPVGVAHGFVALSSATLIYVVDNYYDGADELGVAWNDPALGLDWGVTEPIVSPRDRANPMLVDIPASAMPE